MSVKKNTVSPLILAVETSCDETACALLADGRLVGERIYSQWRQHRRFGGVVPELASRDHLRRLLPMIAELLNDRGQVPTHIAYTRGPGLASALLAGATVANSLACAWQIPALAVNHLHGHLLSPLLSSANWTFPYLALLISGGHTQLWEVQTARDFGLLAATLDDAAGEAFDKTAVLLGLNYPGGAKLEKLAAKGDATRFCLPSPAQKNLNFSFSGLKSATRRLIEQYPAAAADIAAAFQHAAADGLARQTARALQTTTHVRLAVVGGVAQNNAVWRQLHKHCGGATLCRPSPAHCGDNAAMIALTALWQLSAGAANPDYAFSVCPRDTAATPLSANAAGREYGGR